MDDEVYIIALLDVLETNLNYAYNAALHKSKLNE